MNSRAPRLILTILTLMLVGRPAVTQVLMQPTPNPTVTAENEGWYLAGDPIMHAGNLYFPGGAPVFFNPNEMIRSGVYMGIPLYTRTTIEPHSLVYVPVAGGRMQPYERPRSGELAGTAGSMPSSVPTAAEAFVNAGFSPQAAGPPTQTTRVIPVQVPRPAAASSRAGNDLENAGPSVGTVGVTPSRPPTHTRIGGRPLGSNSMFIEFQKSRWYPSGGAQPIDTSRLVSIGDYKGFGVWVEPTRSDTIYVPVTPGGSLAVAYSKVRVSRRHQHR